MVEPAIVPAFEAQVEVEGGTVCGAVHEGVFSFKGIPFAAPPVGALRWRPPQPVARWPGVRQAVSYAPDCMQLPFPADAAPLRGTLSEDCLYLNVWRPARRSSRALPVMVWIHGGGFVNGGTSPAVYDGSEFARDGIVLVSCNYRLGNFGFFAHPALNAEQRGGLRGNYAFMDQIAALEWVRRNIGVFGGDPQNVTLFGESAGGAAVHVLLTSPLARGLFAKAIIQSGGGRPDPSRLRPLSGGGNAAEAIGVALARRFGLAGQGADTLAQLRAIRASALASGLNMATMGADATYAGPILDGELCLGAPTDVYAAGEGARVPVMIGANSMDLGGDQRMAEPARAIARLLAGRGQPVYEFRFSYVAESLRATLEGAPHASEIPFVFDTVAARYGKDLTPADQASARTVHRYWVAFARNGRPEVTGEPAWPAFEERTDLIMNFTERGALAGPDPWKARLDLAESANAQELR